MASDTSLTEPSSHAEANDKIDDDWHDRKSGIFSSEPTSLATELSFQRSEGTLDRLHVFIKRTARVTLLAALTKETNEASAGVFESAVQHAKDYLEASGHTESPAQNDFLN